MDSPIGQLTLAAVNGRVCLVHFGPDTSDVRAALGRWYQGQAIEHHPDPAGVVSALTRYFGGDVHAIDDVAVELNGTPFQRRVWDALRSIRAGTTTSYAQLARSIGAAAAVRAVGAANGANPVAVIVPCHRVIGSDGSLTGYGGGLDRKRWLLRHEGMPVTLSLLEAR
jgi:methylated-DNA-[protein]-cysteine S-methyltransferase